jgi:histidine triad (HIT) family protein
MERLTIGCPFCDIMQGRAHTQFCDQLWNDGHLDLAVIEPLNPVVPGHRLAICGAHVSNALEDPYLSGRLMHYACNWASYRPGAVNIITSVGPEATQTVDLLHLHIVPRRKDDGLMLPWTGRVPAS